MRPARFFRYQYLYTLCLQIHQYLYQTTKNLFTGRPVKRVHIVILLLQCLLSDSWSLRESDLLSDLSHCLLRVITCFIGIIHNNLIDICLVL